MLFAVRLRIVVDFYSQLLLALKKNIYISVMASSLNARLEDIDSNSENVNIYISVSMYQTVYLQSLILRIFCFARKC